MCWAAINSGFKYILQKKKVKYILFSNKSFLVFHYVFSRKSCMFMKFVCTNTATA